MGKATEANEPADMSRVVRATEFFEPPCFLFVKTGVGAPGDGRCAEVVFAVPDGLNRNLDKSWAVIRSGGIDVTLKSWSYGSLGFHIIQGQI